MLLEIVTRCFKRPEMLENNRASLAAQFSSDWQQTLLIDPIGVGVEAANAQLALFAPIGDYVWVLDDDDMCVDDLLVVTLQRLVVQHNHPPAIMLRMDHGELGVLPDDKHWGREPVRGGIGCSAIVTMRDVWNTHRPAWACSRYDADFEFIHAVWREHAADIVWEDRVASRVQRISRGAPSA